MVDGGALGPGARARMDAALPRLLAAVRRRRRRRRLVRVTIVVALFAAAGIAWPHGGAGGAEPDVGGGAVPRWHAVATDPAVLVRCTVPTVVRAEWFVDDAGLRALLRDDDRPDGLVRTGGRVLVSAAAVDPFPVPRP